MVTRNLNGFNLTVALEIIHDIRLIDVVHLLLINKSLNTNLTVFVLLVLGPFGGSDQGWGDSALPLLHFLLELGGLGGPVLLSLRCLYHQSLTQ